MRTIYEPKGRAREYAPYAINLWQNCEMGCKYCFAPSIARKSRADYLVPKIREGILGALEKAIPKFKGKGPVLLSFMSDCYPKCEKDVRLTHDAIRMMGEGGVKMRLLTKAPRRALELDAGLLVKHKVDFGTSLVFIDDEMRKEWEPNAETVESRLLALREAKELGLTTWVSMEPVIDPAQALAVIDAVGRLGYVDRWMVSKVNHNKELEAKVEEEYGWAKFARNACAKLTEYGANYAVKLDLWDLADEETKKVFPRASMNVLDIVNGVPDIEETMIDG